MVVEADGIAEGHAVAVGGEEGCEGDGCGAIGGRVIWREDGDLVERRIGRDVGVEGHGDSVAICAVEARHAIVAFQARVKIGVAGGYRGFTS